jgi:pseudaminic acid synthase
MQLLEQNMNNTEAQQVKTTPFTINGREIGPGSPTYIIAELSANHGQELGAALQLVEAAAKAGADAVKLQTYTPDTLTIPCDNAHFRIDGTLWHGKTLYELYGEAYTPWEWLPELQAAANRHGLDLFSTPFDASAVEFLQRGDVPAYKIASFELVDLPLLRAVARTGRPMIVSTGMATLAEIEEAVETIRAAGGEQFALLKCTSAYPAPASEMRLGAIPHLINTFGCPVGLSDHTLELTVPITAVALGACIIEKHFTLSRSIPGPDSAFSLEPEEFAAMVRAVRVAESALGQVSYGPNAREEESRIFRRSLFVVQDVAAGEMFTPDNVRSIRPGNGLHTRHLDDVLGQRAAVSIARGTPLAWELIANDAESRDRCRQAPCHCDEPGVQAR